MAEVVPAIIPQSFDDLIDQVGLVREHVKTVQVDIMDGEFAPEPSFPFIEDNIHELRKDFAQHERIGMELDMMVMRPGQYFDEWERFGVQSFIIHLGTVENLDDVIENLRMRNKGVGLAFKPSTPLHDLDPYVEKVDFLQHMGNDKIGYHGVELDNSVIDRVRDLRKRYENVIIGVDIGVNFETAPSLVEAGVSKLVSGSAIYNSENIQEAIQKLSLA